MKLLIPMALAATALVAADGNSDSAKVDARVQVVAPIKVTRLSHIDFGKIVVDDYHRPASVQMRFKGWLSDWTPMPETELIFNGCARFRASEPHTPGLFEVQRDAREAPSFGGYMAGVRMTFDTSVVLRGGHGGDVLMVVDTDLPAEDYVPADPVAGVLYSRFQVGGKLLIPARSLGAKKGDFNVTVAYL